MAPSQSTRSCVSTTSTSASIGTAAPLAMARQPARHNAASSTSRPAARCFSYAARRAAISRP